MNGGNNSKTKFFLRRFFAAAFSLVLTSVNLSAQTDSLTLEVCLQKAYDNFPLLPNKNLFAQQLDETIQNLKTSHLPQFTTNVFASYQEPAVSIPLKIPGLVIPDLPKDKEQISLDATQVIFDGGAMKAQMGIQTASEKIQEQQIETEAFKLRSQINQLYFGILIADQTAALLSLMKSDLHEKESALISAVNNGVGQESNLLQLQAEQLKLEQKIAETISARDAASQMLCTLCGLKPADNILLSKKFSGVKSPVFINRPELTLFELQTQLLQKQSAATSAKTLPKIGLFTQLGYGKPGLNMFETGFNPFFVAGVKMSWSPVDWKMSHREKDNIGFQKTMIQNQKNLFLQSLELQTEKQNAEEKKFDELMKLDLQIVDLKAQVEKISATQLENGALSSADYIHASSEFFQAKLNLEIHRLQMLQAQSEIKIISGN